jgi:hypothetical protein
MGLNVRYLIALRGVSRMRGVVWLVVLTGLVMLLFGSGLNHVAGLFRIG